jgi:hypothetical protein
VSETPDVARLSRNWMYWSGIMQLGNVAVSTTCDDCAVLFSSTQSSVHLRHDGDWWVVDTVDERGDRRNDTAKFSTYALAEKYLVWIWATTARSYLGASVLDTRFYNMGFAPSVEAIPIKAGIFELRSPDGNAVLMEPYATIFSHLLHTSEEEIEQMVRAGI